MAFLLENVSENLAARITNKGRKKIAQGNFNISYFQVGDSEFDYTTPFYEFDGDINAGQKVLMPFDKDSQVKYPYKYSDSALTGTTYGTPVQSSVVDTITNNVPADDPWDLNTVWSNTPAGLDPTTSPLTEFPSNVFVSAKEYFGYNSSSGQTNNTGTTITNTFGDPIPVPPEEQHSISILHYSKVGVVSPDPDLPYKYEDYIDHSEDGVDDFQIYIQDILYDRNTGTTIGALFYMGTDDYYINSSASDTKINQMKFRYLLDEQHIKVGKIFVNHKVIIFDDQEIVAVLDDASNRKYTLPIPRISTVPVDTRCDINGNILDPLISGGTNETIFITYLLQNTGAPQLDGMCCNYYSKITGSTVDSDASIRFDTDDFQFMNNGYVADTFQILVQKVVTGSQPDSTLWRIIDFTGQIPNHTVGLIDPVNLRDARFIITNSDYEGASLYVIPDADYGEFQTFTGVTLTRATDIEVMRFYINLPEDAFTTTQNPSYITGVPKRITEVALLDDNKDVLVIAKASSPIIRSSTLVLTVQIDI